jgi:hypothetical protein
MTSLKMAFHERTGRRIVEVFDDSGEFVCAIYPGQDGSNSIHIVSKHFADEPIRQSAGLIPVPGYIVQFKPKATL